MSSDYLISESKVINRKLTYSIPEAAKVLGVSNSKMYQIAKISGFPTIVFGKRLLISVKGLERWIDEQAEIGWQGSFMR